MKLRRKKRLMKLFVKNNVELVLHGHSHEVKKYSRQGIKFINAGASVDGENQSTPGYFLIDSSANEIKTGFKNLDDRIQVHTKSGLNEAYSPQLSN